MSSTAVMHTNHGDITIELFDEDAPKTVENFKKLAGDNFYNGVIFHRVIKDFMIQGGDPTGTGRGGRGTNGSQFFITLGTPTHLQGKHTIFGQVADEPSRAVVAAIGATPTDRRDRPEKDVVIERITIDRG